MFASRPTLLLAVFGVVSLLLLDAAAPASAQAQRSASAVLTVSVLVIEAPAPSQVDSLVQSAVARAVRRPAGVTPLRRPGPATTPRTLAAATPPREPGSGPLLPEVRIQPIRAGEPLRVSVEYVGN